MIEFASGLQWWHWWIAAAVLGIVEAMAPGAVAIWFAAAAAVVGPAAGDPRLAAAAAAVWRTVFAALACGAAGSAIRRRRCRSSISARRSTSARSAY
jgi:membrane protein implicated in regulation of membrane protease activity